MFLYVSSFKSLRAGSHMVAYTYVVYLSEFAYYVVG